MHTQTDVRTDERTHRTDVLRFLIFHAHRKLMGLTSQAHFNPITPSYPNPNLALTSLNTAVQIANLIMFHGQIRTDGQTTDLLEIEKLVRYSIFEFQIEALVRYSIFDIQIEKSVRYSRFEIQIEKLVRYSIFDFRYSN